jgi:hypothetical protein
MRFPNANQMFKCVGAFAVRSGGRGCAVRPHTWGEDSWVTLHQTGNLREHNNYWYLITRIPR